MAFDYANRIARKLRQELKVNIPDWTFDIKSDFYHWAVGAGFFSSQAIYLLGKNGYNLVFSGIYDCGSHRRLEILEREIDEFISKFGSEHDVLWISHFDIDHIKGVPLLKSKGVDFRAIYAPYLTPASRFYMFAESLIEDFDNGGDEIDELVALVANPNSYLEEMSENVILVEPGANGVDDSDPIDTSGLEPNSERGDWVADSDFESEPGLSVHKLSVQESSKGGTLVPIWRWSHIMLQDPGSLHDDFLRELAKRLSMDVASLMNSLENVDFILDLLANKRDVLRDSLNQVATVPSNIVDTPTNDSSLMLISTPATSPGAFRCWRTRPERLTNPASRPEVGAWGVQPGWVAFGDAPLGGGPEFSQVRRWIGRHGDAVGVIGLPHHGSKSHQSDDIFTILPKGAPAVVGADGKYGHPHYKTVCFAADNGSSFVAVTSNPTARYVHSSTTKFTS